MKTSVIKILKSRILLLLENLIFRNLLISVYRDIFIFTTYIHHNFLFFVFYFLFHFFCLWLCTYRQQELLYNAEFQIQQIERKVARGLGERSDEEKRQLRWPFYTIVMFIFNHTNMVTSILYHIIFILFFIFSFPLSVYFFASFYIYFASIFRYFYIYFTVILSL